VLYILCNVSQLGQNNLRRTYDNPEFPGRTEENRKILQSGWLLTGVVPEESQSNFLEREGTPIFLIFCDPTFPHTHLSPHINKGATPPPTSTAAVIKVRAQDDCVEIKMRCFISLSYCFLSVQYQLFNVNVFCTQNQCWWWLDCESVGMLIQQSAVSLNS